MEESEKILSALSFQINTTMMYTENLVCKEMQANVSKTTNMWSNIFYSQQQGMYKQKVENGTVTDFFRLDTNRMHEVKISRVKITTPHELVNKIKLQALSIFKIKTSTSSIYIKIEQNIPM